MLLDDRLYGEVDDSCALWDSTHYDTSLDGDIGYASDMYPYEESTLMKAGTHTRNQP